MAAVWPNKGKVLPEPTNEAKALMFSLNLVKYLQSTEFT